MNRRRGCAAWALLGLTFVPAFAAPVPPSPRPSPPPNPRPAANVAARTSPSPSPLAGAGLYGRRARRLAQSYLRLKLLELRETDLDRAREVIERRLGADALLAPGPLPSPVRPSGAGER